MLMYHVGIFLTEYINVSKNAWLYVLMRQGKRKKHHAFNLTCKLRESNTKNSKVSILRDCNVNPLSANPTKWPNTLKHTLCV